MRTDFLRVDNDFGELLPLRGPGRHRIPLPTAATDNFVTTPVPEEEVTVYKVRVLQHQPRCLESSQNKAYHAFSQRLYLNK